MPYISAELIERTWRRVGGFKDHEMIKLQKLHIKEQKPLTLHVYELLPEFREDACGVAIYVYQVVLEAFRNTLPRPKRAIENNDSGPIGRENDGGRMMGVPNFVEPGQAWFCGCLSSGLSSG
jgi:hypothetical protein